MQANDITQFAFMLVFIKQPAFDFELHFTLRYSVKGF